MSAKILIPQPILEAAQQKLIEATTEAVMAGRRTPFLFSFVLGDDAHGRYYFTTGHPAGAKPPDWYRHLESVQVWRAGERAGEWLDYTVFKLVKVKDKVAFRNEAYWIDGLEKERSRVRIYSTLADRSFWIGWGRIPEHVSEFMTQWLLAN